MKTLNLVKKESLAAAICLLLMFCFVNYAAAAQEADKWQYEATSTSGFPPLTAA